MRFWCVHRLGRRLPWQPASEGWTMLNYIENLLNCISSLSNLEYVSLGLGVQDEDSRIHPIILWNAGSFHYPLDDQPLVADRHGRGCDSIWHRSMERKDCWYTTAGEEMCKPQNSWLFRRDFHVIMGEWMPPNITPVWCIIDHSSFMQSVRWLNVFFYC